MMDRREFFQKAFAAGIVATVPYSIFEETSAQIEERVVLREIDFGDYRAVLTNGETVIAISHRIDLHMERPAIDVTTSADSWREFIPGPMSFNITMYCVTEGTQYDTLLTVLQECNQLTIYIQDREGNKYTSDCYLIEMEAIVNKHEPLGFEIGLRGSGALIMEEND